MKKTPKKLENSHHKNVKNLCNEGSLLLNQNAYNILTTQENIFSSFNFTFLWCEVGRNLTKIFILIFVFKKKKKFDFLNKKISLAFEHQSEHMEKLFSLEFILHFHLLHLIEFVEKFQIAVGFSVFLKFGHFELILFGKSLTF